MKNRLPLPVNRGHRELWLVALLVVPLVVVGFALAAMGVLVNPPSTPSPTPTAISGSPPASPAGHEPSPDDDSTPAVVIPSHSPPLHVASVNLDRLRPTPSAERGETSWPRALA